MAISIRHDLLLNRLSQQDPAPGVEDAPAEEQGTSQRRISRLLLVPPTDDASAMEQLLEIRCEIDRLKALERRISKSSKSFTLRDGNTDDCNDQSNQTSMTVGSDGSFPGYEHQIAQLKTKVERLKAWEEYLKSRGSFSLAEDEENQEARRKSYKKKYVAALIGLIILAAFVAIVAVAIKVMRRKGFTLKQPKDLSHNASTNFITMVELARHNTSTDCWLALHGGVYDLTSYANRHPGGPTEITHLAGTDGTASFDSVHDLSLLNHLAAIYKVGVLQVETASSGNNSNFSAFITLAEVERHNTSDDCWLVLHGGVYDLTSFVNRHPGGPTKITDLAGTDGTASFDSVHDLTVLQTAAKYRVGILAGAATSVPRNASFGESFTPEPILGDNSSVNDISETGTSTGSGVSSPSNGYSQNGFNGEKIGSDRPTITFRLTDA